MPMMLRLYNTMAMIIYLLYQTMAIMPVVTDRAHATVVFCQPMAMLYGRGANDL